MPLEFHQLDRRYEFLRARNPQRQQQLLVSLAATGQQTPIIVVAVADQPDRYLVIDGYQRIAALEQLGRDTVEAVVWPLSEAEALVLDSSLRWSKRDSGKECEKVRLPPNDTRCNDMCQSRYSCSRNTCP